MEHQGRLLENRNDAAQILGISLRKLEYLIQDKKIRVVRIGKRVLVPRRSLEEFCRKNAQ